MFGYSFRTKTKHSKKNLKPVLIPLTETIQDLICKWGNPKQKPQDYVFNVLAPGLTPLQTYNRAHDFYSKINAGMKLIAEKQKIADKTTTYVARHSYASVMKRNGAPKELISENLGHSDLRTTEIYLASFEMDIKLEYNSKLLDL